MKFWLLKSDTEDYPLSKFIRDQVTPWEGVRNYQARNYMTKEMMVGDRAIFYHSNAEPAAAVAVCEIVSAAKPDRLALDKKSDYYDPKATRENPIWECVDVKYVASLPTPVTLPQMRTESALAGMTLLKRGNRLSITPLTAKEFQKICQMGNLG